MNETYEKAILSMDFRYFFQTIFRDAFEKREGRKLVTWKDYEDRPYQESYLYKFCKRLESNDRTVTIGGRSSTKSNLIYAYILWKMCQAEHDYQILYMSYVKDSATRHTKNIRKLFEASDQLCKYIMEPIKDAETILEPRNKITGASLSLVPIGIFGFKRGDHCDLLIGDDLLEDPKAEKDQRSLNPAMIRKVTDKFLEEALELPKKGGEIHIIGTAQHKDDLLFKLLGKANWDGEKYPAVIDPQFNEAKNRLVGGEIRFREYYTMRDMNQKLANMGYRAFCKEHLCIPTKEVDSYLDPDQLRARFGDMEGMPDSGAVVGGHDIGKKQHPSFAIVMLLDGDGHLWELDSKWMDGWDYNDQVDWWKKKADEYGVDLALYDNTRGEFEALEERGRVPEVLEPLRCTAKNVSKIAAELDRKVSAAEIHFKKNERTESQMLMMDSDLKAPTTPEGHADSFVGAALACYAASQLGSVAETKQAVKAASRGFSNELGGRSRWGGAGSDRGSRWR